MEKIKTYNDSKDFPFWNYKRVIQSGDFFYVIKGYESGDNVETTQEEMKVVFDNIVQDYVFTANAKSEDILQYGKYLIASNEINKLTIIYNIICLKQSGDELGLDITKEDINSVLSLVKMPKSDDLEKQKEIIATRIERHKNDLNKTKSIIDSNEDKEESEVDLDEQYINVCAGLEMPLFDESKVSLYQYGIMIKNLIKKIESLNNSNN